MDTRIKRDFCFRDWRNLSAVFEMSKIGPRPLLDILIQKWGGVVLNRFYIYRYTITITITITTDTNDSCGRRVSASYG